ncbi:DUF2515 family protein [Cohnella sp. 56]|uniref:DUF2515 family protein n=1 Tax=Cohnella sp. 56 TaxID=3113722 RepID=UPI0030E90F15
MDDTTSAYRDDRGQSGSEEMTSLSGGLAKGAALKWAALLESVRLARPRSALRLPPGIAAWAEAELGGELSRRGRGASSHLDESNAALVASLRAETEALNRNNVTRTAAYLDIYRTHPELHWALLAHLVSRNGGWNMTDLQGAWLPRLLPQHDRAKLFGMLESCNALIFRDAYPQLRLYEESRRAGRSRFALLSAFGVSAFMKPFWERFWIERDPAALTVALIVNEQHVIERRIVQDPAYKNSVLGSAAFKSMRPLQLQQVVVPMGGVLPARDAGPAAVLAGRVLESFASVDERIAFGKSLYAMLFAYPKVLGGALAFAETVAHTGSRADYWPDRFRPGGEEAQPERRDGGTAGRLWHSPRLEQAWPDRPLGPVDETDWLSDLSVLRHFRRLRPPLVFVMTHEHEYGQRKLEAAAAALERLGRQHASRA